MSIPSADHPDWSREQKPLFKWDPARSLLASIRSYQCLRNSSSPLAVFGRKLAVIRHRFWSIVTGADIPINADIGGGLLLPHPNGVVIHPGARIGPNCLIFQQVTIGMRGSHGVPVLGGHVDVGAGARILGAVTVGNDAEIGANAVVLVDVPCNHVAVGVPAVVRPRKGCTQVSILYGTLDTQQELPTGAK